MSKVAVVYWSSTGNTEKMANEVVNGAKAAGAETDLIYATDFDASKAAPYDAIAFGCPAMGDETLEDTEFEPMFDSVKNSLGGKKVALFGSYGWGDGDWMRSWEDDCNNCGINLVTESVICNEEPDDEGIAKCQALGKALA